MVKRLVWTIKGLVWRFLVLGCAAVIGLGGLATAQPSVLTADDHVQPVLVGLGDSVAAGAGLRAADEPSAADEACGRSSEAYVNRVAEALDMQPVNLACVGATTWNGLITDQDANGVEVPSQLKQVHAGQMPAAAVLTVGANDVRWSTFLSECARGDCADDAHTNAFHGFLASARLGVKASLTSLRLLGVGHVYLTGYYDPLAGDTSKAAAGGFTPEETAWYQERLGELNAMLEEAASTRSYVTFVPVDLNGSDMVQSVDDPAPFHPTAAGQAAIAEAVVAAAQ